MIMQLISTSPHVTSFGTEGQFLPEAKPLIGGNDRWDPDLQVDWKKVKEVFYSYWSPFKRIRFEKSPPHIVRASQIAQEFPNCYYLITIRNPYAQIEGSLRRGWATSPTSGAERWVKIAKAQLSNLEVLERTLFFSYEQLTDNTAETIQKLMAFLPEIESLSPKREYTAHNITGQPIMGLKNLNKNKIKLLKKPVIDKINKVLFRHKKILDAFGYELIID